MKKNPFPGMNPYLEDHWSDVHSSLITFIREFLGIELPDDLSARSEVSITEDSWRYGLPSVWSPEADAAGGGVLTVTEPMLVKVPTEKRRWIEIRDGNGKLITVIEVLSPWNKLSGRRSYVFKRNDMCAARVNVVEIDLLRGGMHTVDVPLRDIHDPHNGGSLDYLVCVNRAAADGRREVYQGQLDERLPVIRIPLRTTDADVPLDLQALIDRCYETGRYWKLDYRREPIPPLSEKNKRLADTVLREAGLR